MNDLDPCVIEDALTTRALHPFGIEVRAARAGDSLADFDPDLLRTLAARHGVVVLLDFQSLPDKPAFAAAARRFGELLEWNFGHVLDLVVHAQPQNYLFTREEVPYHWDGAFAAAVPSLQLFQCLQAPAAGCGGETTFCDTTRVIAHASASEHARWRELRIGYRTDKLAHYGGSIERALVAAHPLTGAPVLRFAEPVDTGLNPVGLEVQGLQDESQAEFLQRFIPRLYEPEMVYAHEWRDGDFVFADNHALIHGRRAFAADSPRHIQRIHIL